MKSEKARHRLYESFTLNSNIGIDRKAAFEAVELAEQEAEERMRDELTRWHDPKIELPQNGKTVLIRLKSLPYYAVGCYAPNNRQDYEWQTADRIMPNSIVIGWREIHE